MVYVLLFIYLIFSGLEFLSLEELSYALLIRIENKFLPSLELNLRN